jgi:hypothetical protein
MATRTSVSTVTFSHPFSLGAMDAPQPAGTYRVVFDDEEVADMNMLVLRRVGSFLHTPAVGKAGKAEVYAVSSADLAKAQTEDLRHAQAVKAERDLI